MMKQCGNCTWYDACYEVCVNDKSEHCADFRFMDQTCQFWEGEE